MRRFSVPPLVLCLCVTSFLSAQARPRVDLSVGSPRVEPTTPVRPLYDLPRAVLFHRAPRSLVSPATRGEAVSPLRVPPPPFEGRSTIPEDTERREPSFRPVGEGTREGELLVQGEATWRGHALTGQASWYGGKFQGRTTANGERFDTNLLTAAHKTLPFDTIVRVTNTTNGKSVVVRINDRGPFVEGRVIDLSRAAALAINVVGHGVVPVQLAVLDGGEEGSSLRTIQVASYSRLVNATATLGKLAESEISAVIETDGEEGLHRVLIQGVEETQIEGYRQRLRALGFEEVLIRRR